MKWITLCTILWSPSFKISSFKCNLRQCLSLISLFPRLLPRIFLFHLTWHLILILSKQQIKPSVKHYIDKNQTMYNYMVAKQQNFNLQIIYMVNKLHERNLLNLEKLHDRNKKCTILWSPPLQNFKLQMQSQAVPVSDISLFNVTNQNIFVSSDLAPDIDPFQGITRLFSEHSNLGPQTSFLQNQTRFVTTLSCDLEPEITKSVSRKTKITQSTSEDSI